MTDHSTLFEILDYCSTPEERAAWSATCATVFAQKPGDTLAEFVAAIDRERVARGLLPVSKEPWPEDLVDRDD